MAFKVSADIHYLDGTLAGVDIPAGHFVTFSERGPAEKYARFLQKVRLAGDFIRAAVTGNRYNVTSEPTIEEAGPCVPCKGTGRRRPRKGKGARLCENCRQP